jgi:hypothetical protein
MLLGSQLGSVSTVRWLIGGIVPRYIPFFAVTRIAASFGFVFGSPPYTAIHPLAMRSLEGESGIRLDARAISFESAERWTFFFASTAPLSCLILDQRLWPDCAIDVVENCRHREQVNSPFGTNERRPLEKAVILELVQI